MAAGEKCRFKEMIYEQFARVGKAVSSPKRLELLDLLGQGEQTVEVLAGKADLSVANASQHLQILRSAGLVEAEKRGLYVAYRLAGDQVCDFVGAMKSLAEKRLAEVERITRQYAEQHSDLEPMDRETLRERMLAGEITLLDVRPRDEYRAGHIPGALCIPLEELEEHLDRLPKDRDVVAYCRGQYCLLAIRAVEKLKARGLKAHYVTDGVREWRSAGLDMEEGTDRNT